MASLIIGSGWRNAAAEQADTSDGTAIAITDPRPPITPAELTGLKVMAVDGVRAPVAGKSLYSQYDEELLIRHFFQEQRDGVFLDVRAWHWKLKSTTLFLEKHLGWSGIAVDALKEMEIGFPGAEERVKQIYGEFGSVEVRTATLNEILDANGVRKVNFCRSI